MKKFVANTSPSKIGFIANVLMAILFTAVLTGCAIVLPTTPTASVVINHQSLTGRFAYILEHGKGKQRLSRLVISNLDGSNAKILTTVSGTISNLSASGDGKTLIFTQQQTSFPRVYTYDLTTQQKNLLTPQRVNHFSGSLSPDNQKVLLSSSLNQNPEIFLANKDGTQLEQLTVNPAVDIAPFWSPDQKWFIFTSDRTGLYHPQLYRYEFANKMVSRITTTGDYNANAKISPHNDFISYITKSTHGEIKRVLQQLSTDKTWLRSDDELTESMSFSPDGQFVLYSTKQAIEVASLPALHQSQLQAVYQLNLAQIRLSPNTIQADTLIREPIWLK